MSTFVWKPEYSVSVSILDAQHKKLFALAQNLHDAMSAGRGRDALSRALSELVEYTKTHFAEEESLLASHNYPELPEQRLQHSQLIKKITEFQKAYSEGNAFMTLDVLEFLTSWITNHILKTDYQYGDFFNRLGVY